MARRFALELLGAVVAASLAVGFLVTSSASATDIVWSSGDRFSLEGRYDESESDTVIHAVCLSRRAIAVKLGAGDFVGKGKGEKVRLVFKSGNATAVVNGVSKPSVDSEMTGGMELVTQLPPDDPLFNVLTRGGPVQVTGAVEQPTVWPPRGMAAAVQKFVDQCKRR